MRQTNKTELTCGRQGAALSDPAAVGKRHLADVQELLRQACKEASWDTLTTLSGDGSDRPFFRIVQGVQSYLAAFPSPTLVRARDEARAAYLIGRHLRQSGVPVPAIHAYDPASGGILFEDLGDRLLFDEFQAGGETAVGELYQRAVVMLADLQLGACEGFQAAWCWDTPRYDRQLMVNRESNYFAAEFCRKFMGLLSLPPELDDEFSALADRISQCPANTLLHRDYQSRNLMVVAGELKVIDFQGARFGPLAYDLAALVNDPYVSLSEERKRQLIDSYLQRVDAYISLDHGWFMEEYYHVALQRNLQVLGAYAFLVQERGKEFFRQYITPALDRLFTLLVSTLAADYPILCDLVGKIAVMRRETQINHVR